MLRFQTSGAKVKKMKWMATLYLEYRELEIKLNDIL